ncbi:hypothetical protein DAMA08_040540 [Martiniozyma asiatica (nom. inval.)]|nr:hypothetical protein DAMA08_040540 [Martiniozyma asiatica]
MSTYIEDIAKGPHYEVLKTDAIASSDLQFKVVIVGDSGCGKTSLFNSYIRGSFPKEYEPTIFENHRSFVQRQSSKLEVLSADLWDTAGQEEYERLRRLSYQDADLVVIAYNINAPESLSNIPDVWAIETMTYAPNAKIILVGLKSDMPHQVNPDLSFKMAKDIGAVAHLQVSALMGENIDVIFDCVFNTIYNKTRQNQKLIQQRQSGSHSKNNGSSQKIKFKNKNKDKKKRKCVIL